MDVRICLRVRERRDTDLILGQGMFAAGWHAHTLDAPGKFLVSAEGFQQPRRARGYLVTDDNVRATVERYAPERPALDSLSAGALDNGEEDALDGEVVVDPETALWTALRDAPGHGLSVPELMQLTGMRRTWIYDRLQSQATSDRVTQVSRGRWRGTGG
jgi:S-DNA-T family DNA segregation ATPase FtsK/SpoIIIE